MSDVIALLVRIADRQEARGRHEDAAQTRANAYTLALYEATRG